MNELFTVTSARQAMDAFSDKMDLSPMVQVAAVFEQYGDKRYWSNAEEFLERLDRASRNPAMRRVFMSVINCPAEEFSFLHEYALKCLWTEVSGFLLDADVEQERWAPYRQWVKRLDPHDTVLTFNYDRVPDLLAQRSDLKLRVARPAPNLVDTSKRAEPVVLKLHGSVDWEVVEGGLVDVRQDLGAGCNPHRLAMARPGPSKHEMITSGPLPSLWKLAEDAVSGADAIVFVGYRMPDTDAGTMIRLAAWLRQAGERARNPKSYVGEGRIPVHFVLGSDDAAAERLKGIVRNIHKRLVPIHWPLFAQDFLALVERDRLFVPSEDTRFGT